MGLYWTVVCRVTSFLAKKKRVLSVFVVFTCSCNVKRTLWTNNQAPIVTTINGSRNCYITTNRFAFLSDETILARTKHISNNILNWFWTLFKNVNPWTKRQEKGVYLIFKRNIAHLTHRRALRALIIASAERLGSLFVLANFPQTLTRPQ